MTTLTAPVPPAIGWEIHRHAGRPTVAIAFLEDSECLRLAHRGPGLRLRVGLVTALLNRRVRAAYARPRHPLG